MHHNLAARLLGTRRGTGYTAGVPYLADGQDRPLFGCPHAQHVAERAPRLHAS